MKQALKNSTPSGISRKKTDNFKALRLYLILGLLLIFTAFAVYAQVLIQNAKREQEYVPRIFAQYIAYTDGYLRQSKKYAQMLAEITSKRFELIQEDDFQEAISDYMFLDFPGKNPIPVIITDSDTIPQFWNQVRVPSDISYDDLSEADRLLLRQEMERMNRSDLKAG